MVAQLTAAPIADINANAGLLDFTLAYGRVAFKENCVPCHDSGGGGAVGYPNLIDDDWLWGGTPETITQTITFGGRNTNENNRQSQMPAFGRHGLLTKEQIL